jgi:hypothetical protein
MSDKQKLEEKDTTGFKSALFINPMNFEPEHHLQTLPEKFESLNIGSDTVASSKTTPKSSDTRLNEYKGCITKDLLAHLEESPTKPKSSLATLRKTSELYFSGGEEEEPHKHHHSLFYQQNTKRTHSADSERHEDHSNMPRIDFMNNFEGNPSGGIATNISPNSNPNITNYQQNLTYSAFSPSFFIAKDQQHLDYEDENHFHAGNSRTSPGYDFNANVQMQQENPHLRKLSPILNSDNPGFIPKNFNSANLIKQNQQQGIFNPTNTLTRNIPSFFPKNMENLKQQSQSMRTLPSKVADNKSFMYGKTGWICSMCKNFNYESKHFYNPLVRSKCNRCGKPQARPHTDNIIKQPFGFEGGRIPDPFCKNRQEYLDLEEDSHMTAPNSNNNTPFMFGNNYSSNESSKSDPSQDDINNPGCNKQSSADSKKNKKKPFVERVGDWVCIKCKNLNFSFRMICNRCQLPKLESDKLFEQYMKNLMNYVKLNEMFQNQILTNNNGVNNNVNNNVNNINNNKPLPKNNNLMKLLKRQDKQQQDGMYNNNNYFTENNGNYGNSK